MRTGLLIVSVRNECPGRRAVDRGRRRLLTAVSVLGIPAGLGRVMAQTRLPRVGVLTARPATAQPTARWIDSFRAGLADQGWIDGKNMSLELRDASGIPAGFGERARELVRLDVDVIYALGAPALRAAAAATATVPIVGVDYTNDPVAAGYAKSYGRPGGNVTGIFVDAPEFAAKWFELMREVIPGLLRVTLLRDPSPGDTHLRALQSITRSLGVQLKVVEVRTREEIDAAAPALRGWPQAIIILPSPMIYAESARLAALISRLRLPATSMAPAFVEAGGLIAYGPEDTLAGERAGVLVSKILSGTNVAELPIERPLKYELILNLGTARALRLTIPESLLARADHVIR